MNKTGSRKLKLNRETIAELTPSDLDGVVGGMQRIDPSFSTDPKTKTIEVTVNRSVNRPFSAGGPKTGPWNTSDWKTIDATIQLKK